MVMPKGNNKMRVLLVEDDHLQADVIIQSLNHEFSDIIVITVDSESEFYEWVDSQDNNLPDLIIMDIMLRWCEPNPKMPIPPPEIESAGHFRAGIRCLKRLKETDGLESVPVVIYSVLSDRELGKELEASPHHIVHLEKDTNPQRLIMHIRSLIPEASSKAGRKDTWWKNAVEAAEIKPGWLGLSIDLKRLFKRKRNTG